MLSRSAGPVGWAIAELPAPYLPAVRFMEQRVAAIRAGRAGELVWLLEHPPLYTAGTSARPEELLARDLPVFKTGRGGRFTYHGPGQRVAYAMLDLRQRGGDIRALVRGLEDWLIATLAEFGITGERRDDRVGIWVRRGNGREDKIAAIGLRVRQWVSFHGVALNVEPDLRRFAGIVPCGIRDHGVTSLVDLGIPAMMSEVDAALRRAFEAVFGPTCEAAAPDLSERAGEDAMAMMARGAE